MFNININIPDILKPVKTSSFVFIAFIYYDIILISQNSK